MMVLWAPESVGLTQASNVNPLLESILSTLASTCPSTPLNCAAVLFIINSPFLGTCTTAKSGFHDGALLQETISAFIHSSASYFSFLLKSVANSTRPVLVPKCFPKTVIKFPSAPFIGSTWLIIGTAVQILPTQAKPLAQSLVSLQLSPCPPPHEPPVFKPVSSPS